MKDMAPLVLSGYRVRDEAESASLVPKQIHFSPEALLPRRSPIARQTLLRSCAFKRRIQ